MIYSASCLLAAFTGMHKKQLGERWKPREKSERERRSRSYAPNYEPYSAKLLVQTQQLSSPAGVNLDARESATGVTQSFIFQRTRIKNSFSSERINVALLNIIDFTAHLSFWKPFFGRLNALEIYVVYKVTRFQTLSSK